MASSSTSLSRSRSLRKPTAGVGGGGDVAATALRSEARNTSPSSLSLCGLQHFWRRSEDTTEAHLGRPWKGTLDEEGADTAFRYRIDKGWTELSDHRRTPPLADDINDRPYSSHISVCAESPVTANHIGGDTIIWHGGQTPRSGTHSGQVFRDSTHSLHSLAPSHVHISNILPDGARQPPSRHNPQQRPLLVPPPPPSLAAQCQPLGPPSHSIHSIHNLLRLGVHDYSDDTPQALGDRHYSPARSLAPKPLTATFLAPPSPSKLPANVAASAETARLQAQLLQLHLLHRGAPAVDAAWRASAQRALRGRFVALAADSADLAAEERSLAERENAAAMRAWGGGQLEEKVQALDGVLSGLWSLGEPVGKYARVVRRFERWLDRTVDVVEARRRWEGGGAGAGATELLPTRGEDGAAGEEGELEALFVGELGAQWKEECAGLARKLDGWRRQLWELGPAEDETIAPEEGAADTIGAGRGPSSLARILHGCAALVADMLAELGAMEQIERDAVAQETEWVRRMSREEDGAGGRGAAKAGAIWRAF
ncbi:Aga1 a-agglutinin anchor subunit [Pleurostoma richardsiae]|uniref:Aga1 a-agglutinin anchor subunit n=1 Tax=Pleurostoma richardsiae TaxID=41990 RepID=A0AA38S2I8_9PEZI|nr:Aga1 a-agglutinin anchor subunit [Pleurostoma richardsiae]